MPKIIGIVGSRRRDTLADFHLTQAAFKKVWEPGDRIVSGACPQGGDRFAEIIALEIGRPGHYTLAELWAAPIFRRHQLLKQDGSPIILYPARWKVFGKRAGFERNTYIARDADILIACVAPDRTGGTEDTIAKFLLKGKMQDDILYV